MSVRRVTLATSVSPVLAFPLPQGVGYGTCVGFWKKECEREVLLEEKAARKRRRNRESAGRSRERTRNMIESLHQENAEMKKDLAMMESSEAKGEVRSEECTVKVVEIEDRESRRKRRNKESSSKWREKMRNKIESLEEENSELKRKVARLESVEEEASEMRRKISGLETENGALQEELLEILMGKEGYEL